MANRVVGGCCGGGGALDTSVDIGGEFSFRSRHLSLSLSLAPTGALLYTTHYTCRQQMFSPLYVRERRNGEWIWAQSEI